MKNFITAAHVLFFSILFLGCSKDNEPDSFRGAEFDISPAYVDCKLTFNQNTVQKCLTIKESGHLDSYTVGDGTISGLDYQPGYKYRVGLRLTKLANPPVDGGDTEYTLIKVMSKVKVE